MAPFLCVSPFKCQPIGICRCRGRCSSPKHSVEPIAKIAVKLRQPHHEFRRAAAAAPASPLPDAGRSTGGRQHHASDSPHHDALAPAAENGGADGAAATSAAAAASSRARGHHPALRDRSAERSGGGSRSHLPSPSGCSAHGLAEGSRHNGSGHLHTPSGKSNANHSSIIMASRRPRCCISFLSLAGMVAHHKTCIGVAHPGSYNACDLCGSRFKQFKSMQTHREKAHFKVVQNADTKLFTRELMPETLQVRMRA